MLNLYASVKLNGVLIEPREQYMNVEQDILVSVIIPVFNVQQYLSEALDSVIHQAYEKLEIIVINDGSTDDSGKICDEYAEKDARIVVIHQENKGLSAARNVGLKIMTGDVVAFLDADDAYHPRFVSKMIEAMIRSDADIVICKTKRQYTNDRLLFDNTKNSYPTLEQGCYDHVNLLRAYANGKINAGVWNKVYKRKLWENERFPEGHVYEDIDTTHRILNRCVTACVINEMLYAYRKRQGSITDVSTKESIRDLFLAYSHFDEFVKEHVPEVFSEETIALLEQRRMIQKISQFASLSRKKDPEQKEYSEELRRQIIASGKTAELRDYKFSTQVCYWMICICPRLLVVFIQVLNPVRLFVKRNIEEIKLNHK